MAATEDVHIQCENCEVVFEKIDRFLAHGCIKAGRTTEKSDLSSDVDSPSCSSNTTSSTPQFWTETATKTLLSEYKDRVSEIGKGKGTKKRMFVDIAKVLTERGFPFSWEQVQGRIKTLTSNYKKTNDHNQKSGNDRKTCPFFDELSELFAGNPTFVGPKTTKETAIFKRKCDGEGEESDDPDEGIQVEKEKQECNRDEEDLHDFSDLPEEVLLKILQYLPVDDILLSISNVNHRLRKVIGKYGHLYSHVEFQDRVYLDEVTLSIIIKNHKLKTLNLSSQLINTDELKFNWMISKLKKAYQLQELMLADTPLVYLDFLAVSELKNLTTLDISETKIDNFQIRNLIYITSLTHLYLSFTNVSPAVVVQVAQFLVKLELLDACKIYFSFKLVKVLACYCKNLTYLHISVKSKEDEIKSFEVLKVLGLAIKLSVFNYC